MTNQNPDQNFSSLERQRAYDEVIRECQKEIDICVTSPMSTYEDLLVVWRTGRAVLDHLQVRFKGMRIGLPMPNKIIISDES